MKELVAAVAVAGGLGLVIGGLADASDQVEPFSRTEQVTAVDVVVELARRSNQGAVPPRDLTTDDFQILIAGEPRPIVGVESTAHPSRAADVEIWTIVLYFDFDLAGASSLRWAAAELGEVVADLVALGRVEIVVADPEPAVRLTATRDPALVADALFELESTPMAPSALETVRSEFLDEVHATDARWSPEELAAAALAEEEAIVRRQLNSMSLTLVETETAGSRRAALVINDGFDLEPQGFYERWLGESSPTGSPSDGPSPLETVAVATGRTLAAYGWISLPLVGPERDSGLVYGLRIGKWRLAGPPPPDFFGVRFERESHREPERSEALIELGTSLLEKGDLEEAEATLRRALFHFAGDPRTAKRQAAASAALGQSLERQGREGEAVEAFAVAVALDPTLAAQYPGAEAVIGEPLVPLEGLAETTSGAVVRDRGELDEALAGLGRRVRLTYQMSGPADGELRPTEVGYSRSALIVRAPAWTRSGTPETVAAARVESLLAGGLIEGRLDIEATAERSAEGPAGEVEVVVELPATILDVGVAAAPASESGSPDSEAGTKRLLRATVGVGLPDRRPTVWHESIREVAAEGAVVGTYRRRIDAPAGELWVAVLIEDLTTGDWGCDLVEIGSL